ncbi:hypothetical protein LELG_01807 [Lodderomyces elongisporus NRRL YB-4239]|uniref:NADP-dependent oxidoreductase domain-containing protein n=1 Tax=Lodderomyces elongisporus (strain ATCC 11503 / CBS 2605 / JCM 1781 / NBRC 1676 / NRRL YB-4239) TaxID=379508 RepID=A5DWS0_LODEL|nr:hypothetical protein LELG_01807 [Lodderomyces elongisporus NRRL YB-4239]
MSVQLEYSNLGESGLKVAPIIIGCVTFGSKKWYDWVIEDEEEIFGILKKCYDAGLNTFDTADVYSNGLSEIILGKFLKKYDIPRENVVILSKCFFPVSKDDIGSKSFTNPSSKGPEYANSIGLSRKHILDAAKASVERLGTYMDVYQIHRYDPTTPNHEIMRALNDVVEAGYTRYIGASSMRAVEFAQLQFVAEKHGWHKFISMQNYYNLLYREEEREMIPFCKNNDISKVGIIPWSPIARGVLARPVGKPSESHGNRLNNDNYISGLGLNKLSDADVEIVNRVEKLANKHHKSMAGIATAWSLAKGCNPIVGVNSQKRVEDLVTATQIKLTEEEIAYLDEPYVVKAVQS